MNLRSGLSGFRPSGRLTRTLLASVAVGILVGVLVAGFERLTEEAVLSTLLDQPLWVLAIAPGVGLVLSALILRYGGGPEATPRTSDDFIRAFHSRSPDLPLRQLPAKLAAGVATIGLGGAMGLEGPSIYAGSSIGHNLQTRFGRLFTREESKMLLTAGAAAGVAAIFKTPATGVLFALEAPYRDDVTRRALLPALLASATAYLVFIAIVGNAAPVFPFLGREFLGRDQPELRIIDMLGGALLGFAAGLGGRAFGWFVRHTKALVRDVDITRRLVAAAVILAGLAIATDAVYDEALSLGPGIEAIDWLTETDRALGLIAGLFAFRMVATLTTVVGGGTGGLFIPLAVQGLLMGAFIGEAVGQDDTTLYPTLGLAAFLGAGYRTPIAAVMFVAESTRGSPFVVPALIAAAVSQLVAGSASVASYQHDERRGHLEHRLTLPVTSALDTDVMTVPPDATVSEFVYFHVLGRRQKLVPVVDGGRYLGVCRLDGVEAIPREDWETTTVADVVDAVPAGRPSWTLRDAVATMERIDTDLLVITDDDDGFIGVVSADDIVRLGEILDQTEG